MKGPRYFAVSLPIFLGHAVLWMYCASTVHKRLVFDNMLLYLAAGISLCIACMASCRHPDREYKLL